LSLTIDLDVAPAARIARPRKAHTEADDGGAWNVATPMTRREK
jgi:hypothetical protein